MFDEETKHRCRAGFLSRHMHATAALWLNRGKHGHCQNPDGPLEAQE
jgi:hypothetical protein